MFIMLICTVSYFNYSYPQSPEQYQTKLTIFSFASKDNVILYYTVQSHNLRCLFNSKGILMPKIVLKTEWHCNFLQMDPWKGGSRTSLNLQKLRVLRGQDINFLVTNFRSDLFSGFFFKSRKSRKLSLTKKIISDIQLNIQLTPTFFH